MEDLASFDEDLSDCLYKLPSENLPLVSLKLKYCDNFKMTGEPVSHSHSYSDFFPLTLHSTLQLEEAAKEVADEVTRPRPAGEETVQDIQVMLKSDAHHASIRGLKVQTHSFLYLSFSCFSSTV